MSDDVAALKHVEVVLGDESVRGKRSCSPRSKHAGRNIK